MKVIFFDVDGVLNSESFYDKHSRDEDIPMTDPGCVECLAEIVHRTGAVLVCSSSWRAGWDRDPAKMDSFTRRLVAELAGKGLEIYDKTRCCKDSGRPAEVLDWLIHCDERIEAFLCIDDVDFGWKKYGLDKYWLRTSFSEGGLMPCHIEEAVNRLEKAQKFGGFQRTLWRLMLVGKKWR